MSEPIQHDAVRRLVDVLTRKSGLAPALLDGPAFASCARSRMQQRGMLDLSQYASLVERDGNERDMLASEVAVPETWFYRYQASFEYLREYAAHMLASGSQKLTCASLGCATGVEPWCIAACALSAGWPAERVRVYGVDRSPLAIGSAMRGDIPSGSVRQDLPTWSSPWITPADGSVRISQAVESCVSFVQADLLTTPALFDGPIDIIFCRNVMIYLDAPARELLHARMLEWLTPGGRIFLGHADGLVNCRMLDTAGPPGAFAWQRGTRVTPAPAAKDNSPIRRSASSSPSKRSDALVIRENSAPPPAPTVHAPSTHDIGALIAQRDFARAQELLESYLRIQPSSIEHLELLAGVFSAQNLLEKARQNYERVVYLDPDHGPALLALAELSDAMGRADAASRYRERLKRLGE